MQTVWFCLPLSYVYDCNPKQRNYNKIKLAWGLENKIWMIVTQPWKLYTRLCTLKYLVIIITSITQTLSQILSVREGSCNMLCHCHWVISWITYFRYLDHAESVEDKSSSSREKNQPEEEEEDIKRFKSLSISCYLNRLDAMG